MARKAKKPKEVIAKKISRLAKDDLSRVNGDVLFALNKIRDELGVKEALFALVRQLIDEEKDYMLSLNSGDEKLNVKHANAKGRIASLTHFLHLVEGSGDEIERREAENG